jgi:tRNA threonylcarbamoyladenosine biosynthesis protein TsaE
MNSTHFQTHSSEETQALGERLGELLRPGDLVLLSGELGAGKTTLVQGIAKALKITELPSSPTYVLIVEHPSDSGLALLHLDAYRLESQCFDALRDAGIFEFLDRDNAVKLVEWPERIADWLPHPTMAIRMQHPNGDEDNDRSIEVLTD